MIATALALSLLAANPAPAEELVPFKAPPIRLQIPSAWNHTEEEGSHRFSAKEGEAYFELDVGKVQTAGMKAQTCVDKITQAMGGKFDKKKLGGQPAAMKTVTDKDEAGKEFVTRMYVGCDGKTTWSLSFHMIKEKQAQFAPTADAVVNSVEFLKAEK
ncbi:MAG: hypothetical protein ACJ790_12035 [Myxococcaceae bacterium]